MTEKKLTPDDLAQFRLRQAAVQQAGLSYAMIQAGYGQWAKQIKSKYKMRGPFDVDWNIGTLVAKQGAVRKDANGRPVIKRKARRRKK